MTPEQIKRTRAIFGMSQAQFARCLNVHAFTVSRWERGTNPAKGCAGAVLKGLYVAAVSLEGDDYKLAKARGLLSAGIGNVLAWALKRESLR